MMLSIIIYYHHVSSDYYHSKFMRSAGHYASDRTMKMWWLYFHLLVALVTSYKTVYLHHLDSYTVTMCYCELEVTKCAFTFSSEIRQIQCTPTEFWCVQCPRPAGPSALDKHQIQANALDLSYFTSKSKCKFINLIHTRQKNKIICSCLWKIINKMALKCH